MEEHTRTMSNKITNKTIPPSTCSRVHTYSVDVLFPFLFQHHVLNFLEKTICLLCHLPESSLHVKVVSVSK